MSKLNPGRDAIKQQRRAITRLLTFGIVSNARKPGNSGSNPHKPRTDLQAKPQAGEPARTDATFDGVGDPVAIRLTQSLAVLLTAVFISIVAVRHADADVVPGTNSIEIFAGMYFPGPDSLELEDLHLEPVAPPTVPAYGDNAKYGIRFEHVFTPRFGLQVSGGFYNDVETLSGLDLDIPPDGGTDPVNVGVDMWTLDATGVWFVNPDSKAVFMLFGGLGFEYTDVTVKTSLSSTGRTMAASGDSLGVTAHTGLGLRYYLGKSERVFLNLDARVRWFEDRDGSGGTDIQSTVGIGFVFGDGK